MMSADDATAQGFRLAWRNVYISVLMVVVGFIVIGLPVGGTVYDFFQRAMQ